MIRTLNGTVREIGDGWIVIDVHDIGYLVGFPTLTNPPTLHQSIIVYTHLAVRETALDLYGFTIREDLEMFELLLGVPKVGPKSALQILNQASSKLIVEATHKKDGEYLHKLSGIGKKTCENIMQYLQNKIDKLPDFGIQNSDNSLNQIQTDAIDVLISLGYDANTARNTILEMTAEGATVNSLVTLALKQIQ